MDTNIHRPHLIFIGVVLGLLTAASGAVAGFEVRDYMERAKPKQCESSTADGRRLLTRWLDVTGADYRCTYVIPQLTGKWRRG